VSWLALSTGSKKEHIINTAIKLWQQSHNITKVSLDEIAREAGVSPTTVYNNFGTRERLVQAVIRYISQEIMNKMTALMQSDQPFPAKMQGLISIKFNSVSGMQSDIIKKIWTDPSSRKYIEEITETQAKPMMKAIIEQGQREGYIHPDITPEIILFYFDILSAGTEANKDELARISIDKNNMLMIARLMYFGLFHKEFDLNSGMPVTDKGS
jgi:AcrR family transcriptional regulator